MVSVFVAPGEGQATRPAPRMKATLTMCGQGTCQRGGHAKPAAPFASPGATRKDAGPCATTFAPGFNPRATAKTRLAT
jgi:hypothetical protein